MPESLFKHLQAKLSVSPNILQNNLEAAKATGANAVKFTVQRRLLLILIDYRPLIKYINGVPHYLYVDMFSHNGSTFYRKDASGNLSQEMLALDDVAELYPNSRRFIHDFAISTGNTIKTFGSAADRNAAQLQNNEIGFVDNLGTSTLTYYARNFELQAVMFMSSEFIALQQVVRSGQDSPLLSRYRFPSTVMLNGAPISRVDWMKAMYTNYLIEANLELMEYYYQNQNRPRSNRAFEINRMYTFNEYVPIALKFSHIPNPIVDELSSVEGEIEFEHYSALCDNSSLFKNAEYVSMLSRIGGQPGDTFADSKDTLGLYATRDKISEVLGIDVSKRTTDFMKRRNLLPVATNLKNIDLYSPCFLMNIIYSEILSWLSNLNAYISPLDTDVLMVYREIEFEEPTALLYPFTGIEIVRFDDDVNSELRSSESDCKTIELSKYERLIISYMNGVFGTVDVQTLVKTPRLSISI